MSKVWEMENTGVIYTPAAEPTYYWVHHSKVYKVIWPKSTQKNEYFDIF